MGHAGSGRRVFRFAEIAPALLGYSFPAAVEAVFVISRSSVAQINMAFTPISDDGIWAGREQGVFLKLLSTAGATPRLET